MKTTDEIRLMNFDLLMAEAEGKQAVLARVSGLSKPYISQLVNRVPNPNGTPRTIGPEAARKLERGMGKVEGWMDADHSKSMLFSELNALEAQLITLFRKLPDDDRDDILRHTNNVFSKRFNTVSASNPFANAPAPGAKAPTGAGSYAKITDIPHAPTTGGKKKEK